MKNLNNNIQSMKLLYLMNRHDGSTINGTKNLGYYFTNAFKMNGHEVDFIIPDKLFIENILLAKSLFYKYMIKKDYHRSRDLLYLKNLSYNINNEIKKHKFDAIISFGTLPLMFIETDKPMIFYTDASFAALLNFYKEYSNLCNETINAGNFIEQQVLDKCTLGIFSSDWAAKTAIDNYNVNPNKIKVVHFGANLENFPDFELIKNNIKNKSFEQLNLLFIGADWDRKNGGYSLQLTKEINKLGINAILNIVGCKPEIIGDDLKYVNIIGFLNKGIESERILYEDTILKSHFLILFTKADCSPHSLTEANANGVPCIASNIGGIPSTITNGKNGYLYDLNTNPEIVANDILKIINNPNDYKKLSLDSYNEFTTRFTWKTAGEKVTELLEEYCR